MRILITLTVSVVFIGMSACCSDPNVKNDSVHGSHDDELIVDTVEVDSMLLDTGQYVDEESETANLIEAQYGEQWDFCDCVVKNDSVNKAVDAAETDEDFDRVIARMDQIDAHCKAMLAMPNTTPDERAAHERKVRKCLKNAGQ